MFFVEYSGNFSFRKNMKMQTVLYESNNTATIKHYSEIRVLTQLILPTTTWNHLMNEQTGAPRG